MQIKPVPGVLIYRFLGPVCFVNSRVFRARLEMMVGLYGQMTATPKDGCLQQLYQSVSRDYFIHNVWYMFLITVPGLLILVSNLEQLVCTWYSIRKYSDLKVITKYICIPSTHTHAHTHTRAHAHTHTHNTHTHAHHTHTHTHRCVGVVVTIL